MAIISRLTPEDYSKAQSFLKRIKPLLATNDVVFAIHHPKNKEFDRKYNMKHVEKIGLLKSLTANDCIKIDFNSNPIFPHAELYFFNKNVEIFSYGEKEQISLYIKMYIDDRGSFDQTIVISFHEDGMYDC